MTGYLLTVLLFIYGMLYLLQPRMLFYPVRAISVTPHSWGLGFEQVTLETEDKITLSAWYIPNSRSDFVILFFQGNAGNRSHRRETALLLNKLGANVFMFDYRGYGDSQGNPTESGLYLDAQAAWNYLTQVKKYAGKKIILLGRSLGGAVAADLATKVPAAGVVLESTFTSICDMAKKILPVLSSVIYMRYKFNSLAKIPKISMPILFIHSREDDLIPYQFGEKLFLAAKEPKAMLAISGGHNNGFLVSQQIYISALQKFIRQVDSENRF